MRARTLAMAVWAGLALSAAAVPQAGPPQVTSRIVAPLADVPFEQLVVQQDSLTPDAGWLVWDPEWRGEVRSPSDMIGQRAWSSVWADGFEALRALDANRDGELAGDELMGLSLWRDENGNGVSEPGEVLPANVHGIAALSVIGQPTRPGLLIAPHGVRFDDGRTRPLYDWTPGRTPVS